MGKNRCASCPLAWESRGYDDCDAGCHHYDDMYGDKFICILPKWIKKLYLRKYIRICNMEAEDYYI